MVIVQDPYAPDLAWGLPACLNNARNFAAQRPQTEANTAHLEFAKVASGPPTNFTAMIGAHPEFRLSIRFDD